MQAEQDARVVELAGDFARVWSALVISNVEYAPPRPAWRVRGPGLRRLRGTTPRPQYMLMQRKSTQVSVVTYPATGEGIRPRR